LGSLGRCGAKIVISWSKMTRGNSIFAPMRLNEPIFRIWSKMGVKTWVCNGLLAIYDA